MGTIIKLLTIRGVAERLGLSPSKIYALVSSGKLEAYKLDGSWRVSEEQLAAFLERSLGQPNSRMTNSLTQRKAKPKLEHLKID